MAEQLEIVIGANVDDAKAGINSLTGVIDNFARQGKLSIQVIEQSMLDLQRIIKTTTDPGDLQKLNLAYKQLGDRLTQLKSAGGLEQTLGGVSRSARLAHSDIDQLSRDLQLFASGNERAGDALSNLVFTFERLQGTTGGLKGALAELGAAFSSPAGIIIGVATAINLLGPFISKLFEASDAEKEAAKQTKELQKQLNELKSVSEIKIQAEASVSGEIEKVNALANAIKDTNLSYAERQHAVEQLQAVNKSFFGDIKLETDGFDTLTTAVNNYTQAIIAAAVVSGFTDQIKKLSPELQSANKALTDNVAAVKKWQDLLASFKQTPDFLNLRTSGQEMEAIGSFASKNIAIFQAYQKAQKAITDQAPDLQKLRAAYAGIEDQIGLAVDETLKWTTVTKGAGDSVTKGLTEAQRKLIELAKQASNVFNIPLPLRFEITDDSKTEFKKAQDIIKGIEDHTIRLKFISLTETKGIEAELKDIQVPKLKLQIDKADTKQQIADLAKGLTIPLIVALDEPSLGQAEDQIKQIFSKFSDTNIFTEFGHNAGEKFRKALLESLAVFNKGFTINPNIDVTDVINSLTTSLAGIKDIQLKVIKTETFEQAIRTLRDLHDAGVEAGDAVEKAMLKAGFSAQDAAKGAKAIADSYHGITKQTEEIAQALDNTLSPAFQDLFNAFIEGKNPVKAFFDSIIKGIESVVAKLLSTQLEKLLLQLLTKATTTGGGAPVNPIGAIGGGVGGATNIAQQAAATASLSALTTASGTAAINTGGLGIAAGTSIAPVTGLGLAADGAIIALIAFSAALKLRAAFSLLPFGSFFAKGGDPAPDKPFIAGEKGWELIVPKTSMHVFTHEQSKSILSTSVKESETIREYLIATRVSQQVKEYFSTTFTERIKEGIRLSLVPIENRISETVKSINTNNDKLTAYTYRLHESVTNNIQSLKESFVSSSTDKDHLVKNDSIEHFKTVVSSFKELFNNSTSRETNNRESLATITATISSTIEKLIPYARPSLDATIVKGDQSSHYENSFKEIERILVKNFTTDSIDTSFKTGSEKITSSFKELQSTSTKAIERLHESVINNDVSTSIDKLHEKINTSDRSVIIERIINNNFFSSDSFKETFKSMSLTDLQKTFHIPAFAQGGAVFGPTLAILGEGFGISRGNPEFVGTRSQLSGIQSGQFDVNVNVDGELSFSMGKLAIALNREQRSSFRTSGKPPF